MSTLCTTEREPWNYWETRTACKHRHHLSKGITEDGWIHKQIKHVCISCRHVIMVDLTDVISGVGLLEVGRQRIIYRWSGLTVMDAAGGGVLGDTGKSLWGMDRKWPGGFSVNKRIKVETDSVAGGTLHTPTGDTSIHFLWNVSGIPGNWFTSTTSLASWGTHPVTTGVWVVGTCIPAGQLGRGLTPNGDIMSWLKSIHISTYELQQISSFCGIF